MKTELLKQESEATQFAMELLMPVEFLRTEMAVIFGPRESWNLDDETKVKALATKFGVTVQVMAIRLGQLLERREL